jgi:hypothetical protein
MNEFGEPNMGNPSVRFDEGRARVGHWPCASQSDLSCLLYQLKSTLRVADTAFWRHRAQYLTSQVRFRRIWQQSVAVRKSSRLQPEQLESQRLVTN